MGARLARLKWIHIMLITVLGLSVVSGVLVPERKAYAAASEPLLGEIHLFPYGDAPSGWLYSAGQTLNIRENTALFSLLGTIYGGNGTTTFNVPDLRASEPIDGVGYYIATQGIFPSRDEDYSNSKSMLGEIRLFPYNFTPGGWLSTQGRTLSISSNEALYDIIGTSYGGDGVTTFNLPNLPNLPSGVRYAISTSGVFPTSGTGSEYMGELVAFPQTSVALPWIRAGGSLISISSNAALFTLLGTTFGGDGVRTFGIPNLNGPLSYYMVTSGIFPSLSRSTRVTAAPDSYETTSNTSLSITASGVLSNDSNYLSAALVTQPQHGTVQFQASGAFVYTPTLNYAGTDSFVYKASNNIGGQRQTVLINVREPVSGVSGVTEGAAYNQDRQITITNGTGTINGTSIGSGTTVTAEGNYTLVVSNLAGGVTQTIHFIIDKTPPVVIGITEGGSYHSNVTFTFNEGTATLNGAAIPSGTTVTAAGAYKLIVTDQAGNTTTVSFTIQLTHDVSFVSNGGSAVSNVTVNYGSILTAPTAPTRKGYTFAGWYADQDLKNAYDFATPVVGAVTLYAKWTLNSYIVSFESNGGTAVPSADVNYNEAATAPTAPTRTGYTFAGWYADQDLKTAYDFATPVVGAVTLYAKWTLNSYTVSFDSNGGTAVPSADVSYNEAATAPTAPTRTGYTFAGWYADQDLKNAYDFATPVVGAVTLYANWTLNSYTVSFESNGGTAVPSADVNYNAAATAPTAPTRTGYTFAGWYADQDLKTAYDFATPVVGAVTLYAKWTLNSYTVSFDSNGGTAVPSADVNYNAAATAPTAPTRTGYTFAGWYADQDLKNAYDFATPVVGAVTLYAKWTLNSYTVSFESNGGTAVASSNVNYNAVVTAPTAPTRAGYTFAGWYADQDLKTAYDFATPVVGAVTLYANWTLNSYTVSFESNGGTAVPSADVNYNTAATAPTAPTRTGYTFAGWYADQDLKTAYDFAAPVVGAVTLYAKWTLNSYTVSFESNGGTAVPSADVNYNAAATAPTAPTRTGYTFAGWYADQDLKSAYDFATPVVGAVTLYAKWTLNSYTVSFDSNGGTAVPSADVNYNAVVTAPTAPTRTGYTFAGWYSDQDLKTAYDFAAPVVGAVTLYANWNADPVIIPSTPSPSTGSDNGSSGTGGLADKAVVIEGTSSDGRPMKTFSFDTATIAEAFAASGTSAVTIEIDEKDPVIQVELPVAAILAAASLKPGASVYIKKGGVSYLLPAQLLNGASKEATVLVTISPLSDQENAALGALATSLKANVLNGSQVAFELSVNGQTITDFNGIYVDRTVTIPSGEHKGTLTAVWFDPRTGLHFVPSTQSDDGNFITITIHSPHNSAYAVIASEKSFADMQGHWAKASVELLASKLIINGKTATDFAPDRLITRAEFAALLVRSLGLVETDPTVAFSDVHTSDWFYGAVGAAQKAGLITGNGDGTFKPEETITREQMAQMIMRAMKAGGKEVAGDTALLSAFTDQSGIAAWARESAAGAVATGIIQGTTPATFGAKTYATRAQTAVILTRMLQSLGFIENN